MLSHQNTPPPRWLLYAFSGVVLAFLGGAVFKWYWFEGRPGSCRIVSESQCGGGRLVSSEGQLIGVGFSLPAGSTLYAPFDGEWTTTGRARLEGRAYEAASLDITAPGDAVPRMVGVIGSLTDTAPSGGRLSRGERLGRTTAETVATPGGAYTVILSLSALDPSLRYFVPTRESIATLFSHVQE